MTQLKTVGLRDVIAAARRVSRLQRTVRDLKRKHAEAVLELRAANRDLRTLAQRATHDQVVLDIERVPALKMEVR